MVMPRREGRIRYAVIGAGNIAQVAVLPAFAHARENSELVAIVSSDEKKRAALARRYRLRHTGSYDGMEDVLREARVDAVYIALPNHLHREFTERAARAGAHVLCEKPMAMTEDDGRAMIAATDRAGVKLMVAYRLHFEEANLRAIDTARSGRLGDLRFFSSVFSQTVRTGDIRTRAEVGGGALFDLGPYAVNAARSVFGAEPTEAFCVRVPGREAKSREVDERTTALVTFPDGRLAQFTVDQGAASISSYRIVGTKGDLVVEPAFDYAVALGHRLTVGGKTRRTSFARRDQFAPEIVYFSRCIRKGEEPEPSGEEGLADVRVLAALVKSAETGRPVSLPAFARSRRPDLTQNIRKPPVKERKTIRAPAPSVS